MVGTAEGVDGATIDQREMPAEEDIDPLEVVVDFQCEVALVVAYGANDSTYPPILMACGRRRCWLEDRC